MDISYIVTIVVAFTLAGIVKGVAGMGLPPTAVALATLTLPLPDALALMTVPTLVTNVWQAVVGGRFLELLKRFWPLGVALAAGVLLSARFLPGLGSPRAIGYLGVLLIVFAITALTAWRPRVPRAAEPWANPVSGFVSGLVGGVTGIAAFPFLPYMQSLDLTKDQLVQALGILFIFFTAAITVALARAGAINETNMLGAAIAMAPTAFGMWLGQKLRGAISPEMFRKLFLAVMLGLGLHMARSLL